uniref:THUMP domain containing 3 n=1 Tax=Leptobrachium leishanense TaxID=445787 RepID=A0A8C5QD70_9ANUR
MDARWMPSYAQDMFCVPGSHSMSYPGDCAAGPALDTRCLRCFSIIMSEFGLRGDNLSEGKGGIDLLPLIDNEPVTIGATVPTGFEFTAASEVEEKLGCLCNISKDRGKIYFEIMNDTLAQEAALQDLKELAEKLPWAAALGTWEMNNSLKKKKRKKNGKTNHKDQTSPAVSSEGDAHKDQSCEHTEKRPDAKENEVTAQKLVMCESLEIPERYGASSAGSVAECAFHLNLSAVDSLATTNEAMRTLVLQDSSQETQGAPCFTRVANPRLESDWKMESQESNSNGVLKFRVTCNRAGDNHSFTSNEAARDFGGAVQEHFQWKADMTNFDIEVLLNISFNEIVVGIALTEESLHRRNITHFGPTTLRSTLAYGMLRLCDVQPSDVIIDPMCGTGAIPLEGVNEWPSCFFMAGDNNLQAVNRTASNICSLLRKKRSPDGEPQGLPIDVLHWNISSLPLRTGSVDVIITDMPFGKRIGSKKKNWDLYPASLMEMSRVCKAGTGRAVLLTHDRKCFIKALAKASRVWRKIHTVWINIGGLHAGVYLLKRTAFDLNEGSKVEQEENRCEHVISPSKVEEPGSLSPTM